MAGKASNTCGDLSSSVPLVVTETPGSAGKQAERQGRNLTADQGSRKSGCQGPSQNTGIPKPLCQGPSQPTGSPKPFCQGPPQNLGNPRNFYQVVSQSLGSKGGSPRLCADGDKRSREKGKEKVAPGCKQEGKLAFLGSDNSSSSPVSRDSVEGMSERATSPSSSKASSSPVSESRGCAGSVTSRESHDYDTVDPRRDAGSERSRPSVTPTSTCHRQAPDSNSSKSLPQVPPPAYDACQANLGSSTPHEAQLPLPPASPTKCKMEDSDFDIVELQKDVPEKPPLPARNDNSEKAKQEKVTPAKPLADVPNTNFAIACMVALCFNLPFGVLAMYFSLRAVRAFQEGRQDVGERRSRLSIVLSLLGITLTTVIISSVVLYIAMDKQRRVSRYRTYGSKGGLNL